MFYSVEPIALQRILTKTSSLHSLDEALRLSFSRRFRQLPQLAFLRLADPQRLGKASVEWRVKNITTVKYTPPQPEYSRQSLTPSRRSIALSYL